MWKVLIALVLLTAAAAAAFHTTEGKLWGLSEMAGLHSAPAAKSDGPAAGKDGARAEPAANRGAARGVASLLVSHDLAAVRALSHRIAVLHRGEVVETGTAEQVCERPRHPYTAALLAAVLEPDASGAVPEA